MTSPAARLDSPKALVEKNVVLADLQHDIQLAMPDKRLVFGEGPSDARLAIVGEAPGREEEAAGRPFVGPAGRLLDRLLAEASLKREGIWITNVVKWRPTEGPMLRTRAPLSSEIAQSKQWLLRELDIVRPRVILCLGNVAARALLDGRFNMNTGRGQWRQGPFGIPTLATFHPAYALRRFAGPGDVRALLRQDMLKVKAMLDKLNAVSQPDTRA